MAEKRHSAPTWPNTTIRMKHSSTPSGTVIAMACETVPVRTPLRVVALLRANVVADRRESKAPSKRVVSSMCYGRRLTDALVLDLHAPDEAIVPRAVASDGL